MLSPRSFLPKMYLPFKAGIPDDPWKLGAESRQKRDSLGSLPRGLPLCGSILPETHDAKIR
jgi:hypothetical protein